MIRYIRECRDHRVSLKTDVALIDKGAVLGTISLYKHLRDTRAVSAVSVRGRLYSPRRGTYTPDYFQSWFENKTDDSHEPAIVHEFWLRFNGVRLRCRNRVSQSKRSRE